MARGLQKFAEIRMDWLSCFVWEQIKTCDDISLLLFLRVRLISTDDDDHDGNIVMPKTEL